MNERGIELVSERGKDVGKEGKGVKQWRFNIDGREEIQVVM